MAKGRTLRNRFGELAGWIVAMIIAIPLVGFFYPILGLAIGVLLLLLSGAGFLGFLRRARIRHLRSVALLLVGVFTLVASVTEQNTRYELQTAKEASVDDYLTLLKERRGDLAWRRELQKIRPEDYAALVAVEAEAEAAEGAEEELERQQRLLLAKQDQEEQIRREEQQRQTVERELKEKRRAEYVESLQTVIENIEPASSFQFSSSDDIAYFLDYVDGMGEFVWQGRQFDLQGDNLSRLDELERSLTRLQTDLFPKARDAYGPIQRMENWRNFFNQETDMRTEGARYRTIRFESDRYVIQATRLRDYEAVLPDIMLLRFSRARFLSPNTNEGTYWDILLAPDDDVVGYWHDGQFFRPSAN